jgi:molecular chaperone DnaK (HSP70)
MICRYDDDGTFSEGRDLLARVNQGLLSKEDVLEFAKLALNPTSATAAVHKKVLAHVGRVGKTPHDLIADYLTTLMQKAFLGIFKGKDYGDVSHIPHHLFLCVPEIWAPASNLAMVEAAKRAGADQCSIVPESLCVAACVLHDELNVDIFRGATSRLQENDLILVADLGGGTADLVLFKLCSAIAGGPNFQIEVLKPATGSLGAGAVSPLHNTSFMLSMLTSHLDPDQS